MPMNATHPSFDVVNDLEVYLRRTFPLFHDKLAFEKVNEHGLLFTWKGTKTELKPIVSFAPPRLETDCELLMAHQDGMRSLAS